MAGACVKGRGPGSSSAVRFFGLIGSIVLCALGIAAAILLGGIGFIVVAAVFAVFAAVGIHDVIQRRHSILRNYPILGHARFMLEAIRPELQQYFIERNYDGRPYDRDTRTGIYERAKGIKDEQAYGTERDVAANPGTSGCCSRFTPSTRRRNRPRVRVGGPDCTQPYEMALLNVSGMSLRRALRRGA